ncbi:hypothetical protein WBG99_07870 [Streptomyces sp. TG1A-60]|uniref:hypothetical protein n=1 Tax=Streptomyces sp. TG1A-60 TaxID=3129111 RepID=UPI0030CF10A5
MTSTTTVDRPEPYRIDRPTIRVVMSDMLLPRTDLGVGSLTCPVTESSAEGIRDLHSRYGDRIRIMWSVWRFWSPSQRRSGLLLCIPGGQFDLFSLAECVG